MGNVETRKTIRHKNQILKKILSLFFTKKVKADPRENYLKITKVYGSMHGIFSQGLHTQDENKSLKRF